MKLVLLVTLTLFSLTSFASVISSFTASEVKGCSPLVVNFTDQSTGNIISRQWNFGNGNTSTQTNPSATFFTPGVYIVKLIVSDGVTTDSSTQAITVFTSPSPDFTVDIAASCPGSLLHFTNHVTPGSAPVSQYAWGFGNGVASSDTNAVYSYPQSGIYDVTLVVQDTNGCNGHITKPSFVTVWPKPTAAFTASPLVSCAASQVVNFTNQSAGGGLSYDWNFGDGTTSTVSNPSHLYSYQNGKATLIVTNVNGCVDSVKKNIAVIYVKADFTASERTVCAGETIHFLDQSPMQGTSWYWNFGDGTTSSHENPAKAYQAPGVYSVTFIVYDNICKDSVTKVSYITVTPGFSLGFTADNQFSCTTPFTVNFTSIAPSGVSLTWNLGNGHTDTAANPTTTYTAAASYQVTLTAVDSSGCTVVSSAPGFINTTKPNVVFTSDTLFCPGASVHFNNYTTNAVRYLWNFGDGDSSTVRNPNHIYNSYGHYTVSLTAWDSIGCDSTLVKPAYIHSDSTQIQFNVDETYSMCPPLVSVFSSHANRNDLKYLWNFGDGYTDTAANPTHIYFHPGVYTVKLTGTSKYGCTNTLVHPNMITVQGPSGTFTMTPNTGCVPVDVSFSGQVSPNTQHMICDLGNGLLYNDSLHFNYTYTSINVFHPQVVLSDQIGCSVAYTLDSIVTHGVPGLMNLRDTSICAGQSVSMDLVNNQYQWQSRNTNECDTCLKSLNICDTCSVVTLQPMDTTIYAVTASENGCSATGGFKIMVDPMPVLSATDTIRLCKNGSTQLNVVQQADFVVWSPARYLDSSTAFQPTCTPAEDIDYRVTAYNALGCTVSQSVPVKVYETIPLTLTKDTAVCAGSPVQLRASVTDTFFHDVTYTWSPSLYLSSTAISDPLATVASDAETFQVTATSGSCPATVASVTVGVNPAATVKLPANIVTTPHTEVSISPVSGDLVSYHWSARDELSCTECTTTSLVPVESQVVYLEGTNQYGCSTSDSMLIHIEDCDPASIFIPNTFTPNGDGVNDKLYVRSKTLARLEYFRLFDRWGAVVFETTNIADGWDGNIKGRIAEQGVYVYQVSGKCENGYDVATSGTVTLIR